MSELTDERRKTLKIFLTNLGSLAMGALSFGSLIKPEGVEWTIFALGCSIFGGTMAVCWFLDGLKIKNGPQGA